MARKKKKKPGQRAAPPGSHEHVKAVLKAERLRLLEANLRQYREQRARVAALLARDPGRPQRERQVNAQRAAAEVQALRELWNEVMPYVRKVKSLIRDVLDHNRPTACYLLFGKISQGFAAIFTLAAGGFHCELMDIVRSNREAIDLMHLFLWEPEDSPLIKKWFEGEIIENEKARQAEEKYVKEAAANEGLSLSISGVKSGIYAALSKYTHPSYQALLEAYDVYNHDFDFERNAGYHWTATTSLPYVRTEMESAILALKRFYATISDRESYRGLDAILRRHAPHMYDDEASRARNAAIRARFNQPLDTPE